MKNSIETIIENLEEQKKAAYSIKQYGLADKIQAAKEIAEIISNNIDKEADKNSPWNALKPL